MRISPVMGDWLHWHVGSSLHFGFHRHGKGWILRPRARLDIHRVKFARKPHTTVAELRKCREAVTKRR